MADAVFINKEEVDLVPIYYDPVHDFGFYRFDPKAVKFLDIAEIELNPEGAKVGVEIRVVGNDSVEKLRSACCAVLCDAVLCFTVLRNGRSKCPG